MIIVLDAQQKQAFEQDGYLMVAQALGPTVLDSVRRHISGYIDEQVQLLHADGKVNELSVDAAFDQRWALVCRENELVADDGGRPTVSWGRRAMLGKPIYELLTDRALTHIAASLIGEEITAHGDYWVRPNMATDPATTLEWHQDSHYYGGETAGFQVLTVWIPLVDVDEQNGCLRVVPGSHHLGKVAARHVESGQLTPAEAVEHYGEPRSVPMKSGDVLILSHLTLHASGQNTTDLVRWSIDLRYSPTSQSFGWHSMGEDFPQHFPCFVARDGATARAESWTQWQARWKEAEPDLDPSVDHGASPRKVR